MSDLDLRDKAPLAADLPRLRARLGVDLVLAGTYALDSSGKVRCELALWGPQGRATQLREQGDESHLIEMGARLGGQVRKQLGLRMASAPGTPCFPELASCAALRRGVATPAQLRASPRHRATSQRGGTLPGEPAHPARRWPNPTRRCATSSRRGSPRSGRSSSRAGCPPMSRHTRRSSTAGPREIGPRDRARSRTPPRRAPGICAAGSTSGRSSGAASAGKSCARSPMSCTVCQRRPVSTRVLICWRLKPASGSEISNAQRLHRSAHISQRVNEERVGRWARRGSPRRMRSASSVPSSLRCRWRGRRSNSRPRRATRECWQARPCSSERSSPIGVISPRRARASSRRRPRTAQWVIARTRLPSWQTSPCCCAVQGRLRRLSAMPIGRPPWTSSWD